MLYIVPPAEPSEQEKVRSRIRRMERPDGLLQCNRCGGRTAATLRAGVTETGRGTLIHKNICAECYKRGLIVPMVLKLRALK